MAAPAPAPGAVATAPAPGKPSAAAPDRPLRTEFPFGPAYPQAGPNCFWLLATRAAPALNTRELPASATRIMNAPIRQKPYSREKASARQQAAPIRELPGIEVPHSLVLVVATICGVLAAIAAQIVLSRRGIELAGVWRDISARGFQLRAAGAWWGTAGSALLVSAAVAAALSRFSLPWLRFRLLRWIAGAALVALLAHIGHGAGMKDGVSVGLHTGASFAAVCAAALTALFGAYFAAKR